MTTEGGVGGVKGDTEASGGIVDATGLRLGVAAEAATLKDPLEKCSG